VNDDAAKQERGAFQRAVELMQRQIDLVKRAENTATDDLSAPVIALLADTHTLTHDHAHEHHLTVAREEIGAVVKDNRTGAIRKLQAEFVAYVKFTSTALEDYAPPGADTPQ
jgi:hypothetical protein